MSHSPDELNQNFVNDCEMEVDNENSEGPTDDKKTMMRPSSDDLAAEALAADMDAWLVFDPRRFATQEMVLCFREWLHENQPSEISRWVYSAIILSVIHISESVSIQFKGEMKHSG